MDDRFTATFTVSHELWLRFKLLCIGQNIPVKQKIAQLIQRELAEQEEWEDDNNG